MRYFAPKHVNPLDRMLSEDREEADVTDPLSLSAVGATVLAEGIKFLYGQTSEILKRWRERWGAGRDQDSGPQRVVLEAPPIFEGQLAPATIDFGAVEQLEQTVRDARAVLRDYADDIEPVEVDDEELLAAVDVLRRAMEAIYQQRLTFRGEDRPPSGVLVEGRVEAGEVAGYAAGLRAGWVESGRLRGEARADRVAAGGELLGVDLGTGGPGPAKS